MRNPARAVSKIPWTIEPLFVLSDRARFIRRATGAWCFTYAARRTHVRVLLHTPGHTFAHIMPPFMPRTCAEQLHFKITDFRRAICQETRARQVTLPTRATVADTNPKFLHHTPPVRSTIDSINFISRQSILCIRRFIKNVWLRNERRDSNRGHLIY